MTPENFVYWLQGYLEISKDKKLDEVQTKVVMEHIGLVLNKVTTILVPLEPKSVPFPSKPYDHSSIRSELDSLFPLTGDLKARAC